MKRSASVAIGLLAALALAACGKDEQPSTAVCVDESTQLRVDEDVCDDDRGQQGFMWFYYPHGVAAPPVGGRITTSHGSFTKPSGPIGVAPKSGGFGTHSGTSGG